MIVILYPDQVVGYGKAHSYITEQAFKIWPKDKDHEIYKYLRPNDVLLWDKLRHHEPIGSGAPGGGGGAGGANSGTDGVETWGMSILEGSVEEDHGIYGYIFQVGKWIPLTWWMDHSWNPDTSEKWDLIANYQEDFATALEKGIWMFTEAINQYNKDKNLAYWYLGRSAHCLQDMAVPAHVHCDVHIVKDDYEEWTEEKFKNWIGIYNYVLLKSLNLTNNELIQDENIPDFSSTIASTYTNKVLKKLFYNLAQAAQHFPSNDADGNDSNLPPFAYSWPTIERYLIEQGGSSDSTPAYIIYNLDNPENLEKIASYLIPRAIQFTAALYKLFWEWTHPTGGYEKPRNEETIKDLVTLKGWAYSPAGVDHIDLTAFYDGIWHLLYSDYQAPYEYTWNLSGISNQSIDLGFDVYAKNGSISYSPKGTIKINHIIDNAQFIDDITIPDGTEILSGQSFTKIWQIKNTGMSTWGEGYKLAFFSGSKMQGPDSVPVSGVDPEDCVDIHVDLVAPNVAGNYKGYRQMRNDSGVYFGEKCLVEILVKQNVPVSHPNTPSAQLSAIYNQDEDRFYLTFSVNEHTDAFKIYYSINNGSSWNKIFEMDNIVNIRQGNQPVKIDNAINYNLIKFKIEALNTKNNETFTSDIFTLNYEPKKPYIEKSTESPYAPNLYGLGTMATRDQVTLRWRKVIDSHHNDNVVYYEIEYADNNGFSNAIILNIGNPSTGTNIYETISYTVTGLQDDKTYYFRVRATNNVGTSPWSNYESIRINIQDYPYFDESYQEPSNGATSVSKTPILRWRAYDEDGDNLDYYITYGTNSDNLTYPLRGFNSDHKGQNWFNFSEEYHEPLKPNTTYYWQIWVREDGHYNDYYGGEYIKSPVWHFTTVATGSDLAIIKVEHEGEIGPGSTVIFKLTVENLGSETARSRSIKCSYIKNGSESPFWTGWGYMSADLPTGQEEVVEVNVGFRDTVWESNGKIYDNVLVSGESQIRFYFAYEDDQDVNSANNEYIYTINYVDVGGPVITYFDIREHGSMYEDWGIPFWARMGQELRIIIEAHDDIRVARGIIDLRYDSTTDDWILLYDGTNDYNHMQFYSGSCHNCTNSGANYINWLIPTEIQPTDKAQVRVRLYDDKNNETIKTSKGFPIYSNRIDVTIEPNLSTYSVGEELTFTIVNDSDNDIHSIEVRLLYRSGSQTIYSEHNDNGILIEHQYRWNIPDKNYYSSQNCYLELTITDIRGNTKTVHSEKFRIDANTELPPPFNNSIILYDEEFDFPADALYTEQHQDIKFVKMDETNIVHAVVEHMYKYYQDTASDDYEDTFVYVNDKFYITYDKSNDTISSKIKICDKNYEVVNFEIFEGTPYALLKSPDGREQYYYTYKSGSSFVGPIIIENENVPTILSTAKINDLQDSSYTFCDPTKHILANGYLWYLNIGMDKILRYPFSDGYIGNEESITIQNNAGYVYSFWIKPTYDGNLIYFIYPWESKLVKFNTETLVATSYDLPFTIGNNSYDANNRDDAIKTSLASKDGKVFIFGNGRVYTLEGENIVEKAHITYTFDGVTVDFADNWDWINSSRVVKTENKVYLIFASWSFSLKSKPTWTSYEILEFDTDCYTFSKSIARTRLNEYIDEASDIEYIGNNKALIVFPIDTLDSSLHIYSSDLKMLDLETGDIFPIGTLPFKAKEYVSLIYDGSNLYAIAENKENYYSESYRLTLDNLEKSPNKIGQIQFSKHNKNLYAAWGGGHPYDGTWNYEEGRLNNYSLRKNKFLQIYPALGSITNFSDEYFGTCLNIVDDYLSSTWGYGKIYSINPDLTINQALYDGGDGYNPLEFKSFGATFIAALNMYNSGKMDFTLFKQDLSTETFDSLTQSNEVATFDDELILVGYGYEPYRSKIVITKLDLTTGEKNIIALGTADNYKKVDINQNKYVAVAWGNFLAVGDFSGDIVQPGVNFNNVGDQITNDTAVSLSWQASDNHDELVKYELYKIVDGTSTLIDTITDVSITSYDYTVSEGIAGEITFKIIAYDYDGNADYDEVTFDIVELIEFISFSVNKSIVQLGEKLIFTWGANGTNGTTVYTVYKKKAGNSEWQEYFTVIGETNKIIIIEGFIGEYDFKIEAGEDSMELSHTVLIEGEIVEFDYTKFYPIDLAYYVSDRMVSFEWDIKSDLSGTVIYELYIRNEDEGNFNQIITTYDTSFQHVFLEEITVFEWKLGAEYQGMKYESNEFQVRLKKIASPVVVSLHLRNNNTDNPYVEIQFNPIEGIDEYVIMRRSSLDTYKALDIINENSYLDDTVEYGEFYEYAILSKVSSLIGEAAISKGIFIQIKEIEVVTIQNENYLFLDNNEITVNIDPDSDECYEKYEVMIGTSKDLMNLFTITQDRHVLINELAYNTTYYLDIYPLDYKNERITNLPTTLVFSTPPEPIPSSPSDFMAKSSSSNQIDLIWTDNSNNEIGFKIERKIREAGSWSLIYVVYVDTNSYSDIGLSSDTVYCYRVIAYNASGNSEYSNEASATAINDNDGDELPDYIEKITCTDPNNPDTDNDGISDGVEDANHNGVTDSSETDPCNKDTDGDEMPDGWEANNNLNPLLNDSTEDPDNDGYTNLEEYEAETDPLNPASIPGKEISIELPDGWNMISLSLIPEDASMASLFPEAVVVYGYEKGIGYVRVKANEELKIGKGYWILFNEEQSNTLFGQPIHLYTDTVYEEGWAMIGGCTYSAQALSDNCSIDVIYGYVQGIGYKRILGSEKLEPGKGYWILFNDVMDQCKLTVEATI